MFKKKKTENIILYGLGIFLILGVLFLFISMVSSHEKYLPSENISVVADSLESKNEYDKVEKIEVKTVGFAVDSYSFDGGINWQKSNEYYVTDSEKLVIIVRDVEGKESKPIEYVVGKVDSIPPVISVNLPKKVALNSKINLGEYVSVSDDNSGVDGSIIMKPESLDTSKVGVQTINFSAKDKAGNEANISVSIEVVSNQNEVVEDTSVAKVLYRYRVKNLVEYNCNSYDCSYYEESDVQPMGSGFGSLACNPSYNEKITFSNGCIFVPRDPQSMCTQAFTTVDRYSEYKINGVTYVVDIYALDKNGKQVNLNDNTGSDSNSKVPISGSGTISKDQLNSYSDRYKAEPCGENELSINGYCHAICSGYTEATCPEGYSLIDNTCKKIVKKTCTDKCSKYTWSEWSSWSETVISPSDTVQVETKVVNE